MYTAEISRNNPSMILFLLDQSGSMQEVFDPKNVQAMKEPVTVDGKTFTHTASGPTKAQALADAINKLLQNLCIKCAKEEGVRDYFHVGVIGYGTQVGPAFAGSLSGRDLVPISEVGGNPARIETRTKKVSDGVGGLVDQEVKFPIWFDAVAIGRPLRSPPKRTGFQSLTRHFGATVSPLMAEVLGDHCAHSNH